MHLKKRLRKTILFVRTIDFHIPEELMNTFQITLLGTAHGDPTPTRFNSSALLEFPDGTGCLIDAGTPALALLVRMKYKLNRLRYIFLTHMHEDHFGGLPDLLKMQAKYRKPDEPTDVYLPEEDAIRGMKDFMALAHRPLPEELIRFHVTQPGALDLPCGVHMEAIPTDHCFNEKAVFPSYAYEFTAGNGCKVMFTGDLAWDFHDFPGGRTEDLVFCELTHYSLMSALPTLKKQNFSRLVFNHVGDNWHGEQAEALFRDVVKDLPFPCAIGHDGEVFSC